MKSRKIAGDLVASPSTSALRPLHHNSSIASAVSLPSPLPNDDDISSPFHLRNDSENTNPLNQRPKPRPNASSSRRRVVASGPAPVFGLHSNSNLNPKPKPKTNPNPNPVANGYANGYSNGNMMANGNVNGNIAGNHNGHALNGNANGNMNGHRSVQQPPRYQSDAVHFQYGNGSDAVNPANQSWRCKVCTYHNDKMATKCAMCGWTVQGNDEVEHIQSGNGKGKGSKSEKDKWQCSACTFSNFSWTDRCEVCQAKRRMNVELNHVGPSRIESDELHKNMSPVIHAINHKVSNTKMCPKKMCSRNVPGIPEVI